MKYFLFSSPTVQLVGVKISGACKNKDLLDISSSRDKAEQLVVRAEAEPLHTVKVTLEGLGNRDRERPSLLIPSLFRVLALSLRFSSSFSLPHYSLLLLLYPPPLSSCKSRPLLSPFLSPDVHPSLWLTPPLKIVTVRPERGYKKVQVVLEEGGSR